MLLIGDTLPSMVVNTTYGIKHIPEDYKGKWLILFSHPGDFTPVCTTEMISFANKMDKFKEMNTELLGLSVDQVQAHIKWVEWMKQQLQKEIQFPIIADSLGKVAHELEMVHHNGSSATVRATFFVDPKGVIRTILYYPAEVGRSLDEIIRVLACLQVATECQVATPADWPYNELIKDKVIIPPATTVKEAKENMKQYDHYDWWFAYKDI